MAGQRRASKGTDPALSTYRWMKVVRPHWQALRRPCARCGRMIDYDSPRYYTGTRRVNPATLVVGHIVGRDEAYQLGWPDERINDISNTQPEHARCSDRSGAVYGNRKRGRLALIRRTRPDVDTSREW